MARGYGSGARLRVASRRAGAARRGLVVAVSAVLLWGCGSTQVPASATVSGMPTASTQPSTGQPSYPTPSSGTTVTLSLSPSEGTSSAPASNGAVGATPVPSAAAPSPLAAP